MTPTEFTDSIHKSESEKESLPGASVDERMYLSAEERASSESENTYLHQQKLPFSFSPKSTFQIGLKEGRNSKN